MNKKYLSALLFGAVLIASTGTFTSCKDYDDDIQGLQAQVDGLSANIQELQAAAGKYVTSVTYDENTGVLTVVGGTGGTYQLPMPAHVPSYTLEINGNQVVLKADGTTVSTATLPEVDIPDVDIPEIPDAFDPEQLSWGDDGYLYYGDVKIEGVEKPDAPASITEIKEGGVVVGYIITINGDEAVFYVNAKLSSITFAPNYFVDGVEAVVFNSLVYADWSKMGEDKATLPDEKKLSTASLATASYHFNPSSFNLDNATYQFIDREADLISRAGATATDLFTVEAGPTANVEEGTVDFTLRRTNVPTTQPEKDINTVALQATLKDNILTDAEKGQDYVITSPYVEVYDATITQEDLFISDKETLKKDGATAHYALTAQDAQNEEPRYEVIYDKEFDLASLVATCLFDDEANTHNAFDTDAYKLSYRFAVAETAYNIPSDATITNQQTVIECTDAEKGLYKVSDKILREAIGRTPILRVELVDESGRVVRRGFVKVEVIAEKSADMTQAKSFDLVYGCASDVFTFELDEEWMRENVYRTITSSRDDVSLSHEEFWNMYEVSGVTMEKNGKAFSGTTLGVVNGDPATGTATKKVVWSGTHGDLGEIGQTGSVFVGTVVLTNKIQASEYPAKVSLVMTINVTLPAVSGEFVKNEVYWSGDAFISNVNYPESETDIADNCLFETKLGDAFSSIKLSELPKCIATYYKVAKVYSGNTDLTSENGVYINGDSADDQVISLDKTNDKIKAALNSQDGLSAIVEYVVKFESGDVVKVTEFVVNFVRPVNLNMPAGLSVIDAKTGGDIVDFGGAQLLTDWRNYAITEPGTEDVLARGGVWRHNPAAHETTVIPGWYEVKQAAQWNIVLKDVVIDDPVDVFGGTANVTILWYNIRGNSYTEQRSFTVETIYDSKATVEVVLNSKVDAYIAENTPEGYLLGSSSTGYTYTQATAYNIVKVIDSIEYIPAEVVYHEPQVVVEECTFVAPNRLGEYDGEIVGCWQWIDQSQIVTNTVPGAYWDFYGPFGELTLDVTKATTNLDYNGGKLPSNVTLTQVGNTVKYENIGTPVNYSYNIYIPASISYGWGTANATLTITVNPATTK